MSKPAKASCLKRLSRIEGQVRGLARMVEEEVLREHISHCVEHAIVSGNAAEQRRKVTELMDVLSRTAR
jgi:DNA-binding FrmR family transcriptional regulator